jgi:UDP-N-acetylglucosamine--N-acetylmuramyl-(pentapeptide) pyrophosphoryl-undecaprenol N-acetylglucosamine transferase
MKHVENTIFIAGGGTGGHLFPALAIGKQLENDKTDIIFIGSKHGFEKKYFKENNIKSELLDIKGIQRNFSISSIIKNLYFPIRFLKSYMKSRKLIKQYKPKIIIGTGGYSSGLPLIAGIHLNIPTVIQDQNSVPGLVTKLLYKKVSLLFLAYKNAKKFLNVKKDNKIFITGNPIRKELQIFDKYESRKKLGLQKNKKTIFILGGSQGSKKINQHLMTNIEFYTSNNFQFYIQCGLKNYNDFSDEFKKSKNIIIKPFINNISRIYSASDLVVSRAGALAITELCYMKKAMILIPFKFAANNHQKLNAKEIQSKKACIMIEEKDLNKNKLEKTISELMNNENKLKELQNNAKKASYDNSNSTIEKYINSLINE